MTEIFLKLVNMSISASWLIVAILVLRFVLQKAPKAVRCVLWCLVGFKLIFPFSIESALSLIPSPEVITHDTMYAAKPTIDSGINVVNHTVNPILAEYFAPNPGDSVNPLQVLTAVAAFVWMIGVTVLIGYMLFSFFRLKGKVKEAVWLRENIYQSEAVVSPFILGVVSPCIYLPFSLKEEELMCVLAHEKAHIRRGDHLWKPLGFLILAVHWFNPLVWIAFVCLCRDIELACDEKVMRQIGEDKKKLYSYALLNCSVSHKMIAACPLAFGEVGVKLRIKNVLSYKKPTFWIMLISILACVVCAVCFMTEPKTENNESKEEDFISVPLKARRIYEVIAQWDEDKVENDGGYGTAYYAFATDNYIKYEKAAESITLEAHVKEILMDMDNAILISSDTDSFPGVFVVKVPKEVCAIEGLHGGDSLIVTMKETGEQFNRLPVYEAVELCMEQEIAQNISLGNKFTEVVNNFDGVTMTMEKYKATEGEVEIHNGRDKEIQYGDFYDIQVQSGGEWYSIKLPDDIAYHMIAYVVEPGETGIWQINWEYAYGELPMGKYRMVKDLMDYRAPGDYDEYYLATEFEIK